MRLSLLLGLALTTACAHGASATPEPEPAPARARARTALSDDELATLRAGLERVRPGMTREEVFAELGVSLDGIGQLGSGAQSETTTIYAIRPEVALYLTWNASDLDRIILLRAELVASEP